MVNRPEHFPLVGGTFALGRWPHRIEHIELSPALRGNYSGLWTSQTLNNKINNCHSDFDKSCELVLSLWFLHFTPPPFSFVYGPAFTYLCIISHQCNASENNSKEIPGHLGSPKSFKLSKFSPSYVSNKDNMASLQWWFHQQRSDWSDLWMIDKSELWIVCRISSIQAIV